MDPEFADVNTCYTPPEHIEVAGDNDYYARKWAAMPPVSEAVMMILRAHALPAEEKAEDS